jgi:hypothetical protein
MMIELEYEMTYAETIDGPLGPTVGSPLGERICWQVTTATHRGRRIDAKSRRASPVNPQSRNIRRVTAVFPRQMIRRRVLVSPS